MSDTYRESQQLSVGSFRSDKVKTVRLTEIFYSLQGEGRFSGLPTVFVRLTGCPLRCVYCDTDYAFHGGESHDIDEVIAEVKSHGAQYVCVTGGEPLAQRAACLQLCQRLCDEGLSVSIETSGAMPVGEIDPRVSIVMDLKTPDSGECDKNLYENISLLSDKDQLKFVIMSRADYEWSRSQLIQHDLIGKGIELLFSPSFTDVKPRELAQWILDDKLAVRMQMQMHKQIWGEETGR